MSSGSEPCPCSQIRMHVSSSRDKVKMHGLLHGLSPEEAEIASNCSAWVCGGRGNSLHEMSSSGNFTSLSPSSPSPAGQ